ncbi:MAG: FG-GAP-like repeat-containing protein, partial [Acetobacteraceae bacterium]|nr:FG-GAP-like repeat-containing protein [Acetobacteraceae bacterium]
SVTFAENTVNATPQLIDSNVVFTAGDSLAGGRLVVAGLLAEDRVSILSEGTGAGQIGVSGSAINFGGVTIGTASGGVGNDFTVTFNTAVTGAAVDALIQRLAYGNVSSAPTATRTLTLDVVDAAGGHLAATPTPQFTALTGTANPFNGIGVVSDSAPSFVDLDADGRLDLVLGAADGTLLAWRNTGSGFTALTGTANPFNGIDVGSNSTPSFVDLDSDGRLDLVSGAGSRTLLAWRNTGTATAPIFTALTGTANPFDRIDPGGFNAPSFVDLDGDGLLDLVSGEFNGTLRAWRNTGSGFTALTGTANPFDGIGVGQLSKPSFVDLDGDGRLDLVSGAGGGTLRAWRNTDSGFTALTGTANPFNGFQAFNRNTPSFVDLDGDGRLDLALGGHNGTLLAWRNTTPLPSITVSVTAENDPPIVTSGAAASFAENGTGTAYQAVGSDPEGTTMSWSLGGADQALFNINATTGAVTFVTAPNFEEPGDAGGDNVYDITVTASDGALSTSRDVAITVTNVNEAPSGSVSFSHLGGALRATNTLSDADGLGVISHAWQSSGDAGVTWQAISGATSADFTPDAAVAGRLVRVVASYLDGSGTAESVASGGMARIGTSGADSLTAGAGVTALFGLGGSDTLTGTAASQTLAGGAGDDMYLLHDSLDFVLEGSGGGTDTIMTWMEMTLPDHVEMAVVAPDVSGITVTGSAGNDMLIGNGLSNNFNGGAGDDVILAGNVTLADIYALFNT